MEESGRTTCLQYEAIFGDKHATLAVCVCTCVCVCVCKFGNEQQNNSRVRSSCLKRCKIHNMTCSIKVDSYCSPQQVCIHTVVATLAEDLAVYQTENLLPLTPEMNGLLETLYTHNYAYNSSVT